jgi:hypothetical protein
MGDEVKVWRGDFHGLFGWPLAGWRVKDNAGHLSSVPDVMAN